MIQDSNGYKGERHTYGVILRPAFYGGIPDGSIPDSWRDHPDYKFGTVDYPAPLSGDRVKQFDLIHVRSTDAEGKELPAADSDNLPGFEGRAFGMRRDSDGVYCLFDSSDPDVVVGCGDTAEAALEDGAWAIRHHREDYEDYLRAVQTAGAAVQSEQKEEVRA